MWVFDAVRRVTCVLCLVTTCLATTASAQVLEEEDALARLFPADQIRSDWFGPAFLDSFSVESIRSLLAQIEDHHGLFQGVLDGPDGLLLQMERADIPTSISLNAQGQIVGLYFHPAVGVGNLAESADALSSRPGEVALLVVEDGRDLVAVEADRPFAVASASKLAVLAAVSDAVASGDLAWDQVVALQDGWQSLPSGILQDWPVGTPITVSALATLAVSESDNTAADALLHLVGRDAVARHYPRRRVFPTTRELFAIAGNGLDRQIDAWLDGGGKRPAVLDAPIDGDFWSRSYDWAGARSASWSFSAREICDLLEATADLPAFEVNPGLADPEHWASVAYKGGNMPGVFNLSTRLVGRDGVVRCVVATWNAGDEVTGSRMTTPYAAILRRLRPL